MTESHQRLPWSAKCLGELLDLQGRCPQGTKAAHSNAQENKPASQRHSEDGPRAPDGAQMQKKFTRGRSRGELPMRNTDVTVPVSETVENTARIQCITMNYYLFSFSGEVNLLSENCLQSPLKEVWYLISLINRMRFHRNWPLKISW